MSPGTSSLVAALVVVCAVLVACVAAGFIVLAARMAQRLSTTGAQIQRTTVTVRREAPRVRRLLARIEADLDRVRQQDTVMDRRLEGMIASLAPIRRTILGVTRGRLAGLIRGAGIATRVAQFALLWR